VKDIKKIVLEKINEAKSLLQLQEIRIEYLSKKGLVNDLMKKISKLDKSEIKSYGQEINNLKQFINEKIKSKQDEIKNKELDLQLEKEKIDIHLDKDVLSNANKHILNKVIEDVEDFFLFKGYEIAEGPELETDLYNFEMMNLSKGHPAREMQDSFYVDAENLLRTHTSPVQAREMIKKKSKKLAIICPGKVYRRDNDDPTHSHQFMQIEGLVVDENINFANLKSTLIELINHIFGKERNVRMRPSYFPFTEPSVEVDVSLIKENGDENYIEVLGAGMVHPRVLDMAGYNPDKFSGFAFGIGVERIAILKYKIDDIRNFYINDLRFLNQFKGDN